MSPEADSQVLDLYKLAVEMADRVSARRGTANSFFVAVQTAIASALGFLAARKPAPDDLFLLSLCGVGVLSAVVWFLLLRSYRDLNRAKFEVILSIEEQLPVRLFGEEWASLKRDPIEGWRGRYAELGSVERLAPLLFGAVSVIAGAYVVVT